MPASSVDLYHMDDAKNNFNTIRPAPVYCSETNYFMGQCRNVHISTNCYYGYHDSRKRSETVEENEDTEMLDVATNAFQPTKSLLNTIEYNARKRSADDSANPASKRLRQEVQTMKSNEPETNENMQLDSSTEDLLETLYWHLHGGNFYQYNSSICSLVGTRSSPSHSASAFNANILLHLCTLYLICRFILKI